PAVTADTPVKALTLCWPTAVLPGCGSGVMVRKAGRAGTASSNPLSSSSEPATNLIPFPMFARIHDLPARSRIPPHRGTATREGAHDFAQHLLIEAAERLWRGD